MANWHHVACHRWACRATVPRTRWASVAFSLLVIIIGCHGLLCLPRRRQVRSHALPSAWGLRAPLRLQDRAQHARHERRWALSTTHRPSNRHPTPCTPPLWHDGARLVLGAGRRRMDVRPRARGAAGETVLATPPRISEHPSCLSSLRCTPIHASTTATQSSQQ